MSPNMCSRSAGESAPSVVEVDLLDLDAPARVRAPARRSSPRHGVSAIHLWIDADAGRSHDLLRNLQANFEQIMSGYFADRGSVAPPDITVVSWLPFYHDMGLVLGICAPILGGFRAVLMSPVSFLQRPARWMQLLATNTHAFSAAPNFAFELAARKTSDDDMAGLDLGERADHPQR